MSQFEDDNNTSSCSSSSSLGGPPPPFGGGGGETAADAELSCPPVTEADQLESSIQRKPSDLKLDSTQTILENLERTRVAEDLRRSKASFGGTMIEGEEVSIVMINGEPYRYPDGKRLDCTLVEEEQPLTS